MILTTNTGARKSTIDRTMFGNEAEARLDTYGRSEFAALSVEKRFVG